MKEGPILRTAWWLIVVAVSAVAQLSAQDTPDFSGRWVLESAPLSAASIPRALSVSMALERTNVRGDPVKPFFRDITVARELADGTLSETYPIGVVGGIVSGRANDTLHRHYRVKWEEKALVIESGTYTGTTPESGQWAERREVWLLDATGGLQMTITTRGSVGASSTIALVYRRQ